ncbi:MAG: protein GlmU [Desulfobacteraceae bacterium]|nr:protein GlmU [Desulfobacteraceae bacterium]
MDKIIEKLIQKGVLIENPYSVIIDKTIDINNIEPGAVLNHGARLSGEKTYISKGCIVGKEGPATIENCVADKNSIFGSGYFSGSVFLEDSKTGSNAHVRKGCILEEKSSIAHTCGIKQTILFPYATLGSLINFCDCMLTGGTSSKNHSEVGSSFIHFNFTPNQDKATPSLMGNVFEGVFLNKPPIFLGGQGGLVGPLRIGFGCTSAAGSILRRDELRENRLIFENLHKNLNTEVKTGIYLSLNKILKNNLFYISNLIALKNWYMFVRKNFLNQKIYDFSILTINDAVIERVNQLKKLSSKVSSGIDILKKEGRNSKLIELKENYCENTSKIFDLIFKFMESENLCVKERDEFLNNFENKDNLSYLDTIHLMNDNSINYGVLWLKKIVFNITEELSLILNKFDIRE